MTQYNFSPLQETSEKIIFPIVLKKSKLYLASIYIWIVLAWIMTGAVLLFPLFLRIDGEIEFPLFIFGIVLGAPLAALSIYISRAVFLRGELLDQKIEISKDSILIENPKKHNKTVFLKDITSFTYRPEGGGRYSSPAILTIKTQQGERIEFIRFNKCLYEFFKINFVEEKRKITWTWIVFITITGIIVIYDVIEKI